MSFNVTTYAPSEVSLFILGLEVKGWTNDSFITVTPQTERVTYRKAKDGKVTAFVNRYQVYQVDIKLAKTSPSNAFLQVLHNLYLDYGQLFKLPIYIKGGGVKSSFYSSDSFIKIEPTSVHSSNPVENTWSFLAFNGVMVESGADMSDEVFTEIAGAIGLASQVMNTLGVNPSNILGTLSEVAKNSNIVSVARDKISGFFN